MYLRSYKRSETLLTVKWKVDIWICCEPRVPRCWFSWKLPPLQKSRVEARVELAKVTELSRGGSGGGSSGRR